MSDFVLMVTYTNTCINIIYNRMTIKSTKHHLTNYISIFNKLYDFKLTATINEIVELANDYC